MICALFQFSGTAMTFMSQFPIGEVKYSSQMCYVNGNIVIRAQNPQTITVHHEETGILLQEWKTCHVFPALLSFEMEGKEYLLEGCTVCRVIRSYESPEISSSYKTLYKDIYPSIMCQGPINTVLVLEDNDSITQLRFSEGHFKIANIFSNEIKDIRNMCYCERNGIVVMVHINQNHQKTLTGVALATGEVVWKHTAIQFGFPPNVLDCFRIPDGRICIDNLGKLFVLDTKDGSIKYKFFDLEIRGSIWSVATCCSGYQQRLAFQHGKLNRSNVEQISVYISPKRWLPLQNIIPDEEN